MQRYDKKQAIVLHNLGRMLQIYGKQQHHTYWTRGENEANKVTHKLKIKTKLIVMIYLYNCFQITSLF